MKYHLRTVTWKFAEARNVLPELKASQNIQITDSGMLFRRANDNTQQPIVRFPFPLLSTFRESPCRRTGLEPGVRIRCQT